MQFVINRIDVEIQELSNAAWRAILKGKESSPKPTLVFVCGKSRYCFSSEERIRVAAIFVSDFDFIVLFITTFLFLLFTLLEYKNILILLN